jgi:acetoin utilization deacetylase AcuC-like enzyme
MQGGIIYHEDYQQHLTGAGHPERPQRVQWIMQRLRGNGMLDELELLTPRHATRETVQLAHPVGYLDWLQQQCAQAPAQLDPDTQVSAASYDTALLAVGGVTLAVDTVCSAQHAQTFVLPRPPGHHASASQAMGFCLLNNVAVAARYAQQAHGLTRVAILDWDVHHGNGTQSIFYDDPSVLYCSVHQYPYYPGTGAATDRGAGDGEGQTLNCPLPAGSTDIDYIAAVELQVLPALRTFQPELIILSAGFDGHRDDPMGTTDLTEEGFAVMTQRVVEAALGLCDGRIVSVLEGGYHPRALPASVERHLAELCTSTGH